MTLSKLRPLVNTTWLRDQILSNVQNTAKVNNSIRVLDTSWLPDLSVDGYQQFYQHAHIPSAVHFDLKRVSPFNENSSVRFPIPDSHFFKEYVETLGISSGTHVVAYDRLDSKPSCRTWFLFRLFGHDNVSILNGGLKQWLADGFHVTTEEPEVERGNFTVNFRNDLLRDFSSVLQNVDTQSEQLMDARARSSQPGTGVPESHIPGSRSVPFSSLFNQDGTFKSKEELSKLFENAGIDLNKPVISSCQTGMTACGLMVAANVLGKQDVPLYNGSFYEWSKLADSSRTIKTSG